MNPFFFDTYIKKINNSPLVESITKTNQKIKPYIANFSYSEHITGLLLGNIQSGKTSHVFGVISSAADEGFKIFILLTTDNISLYSQTFKRALESLGDTFNVCREDDSIRYETNKLQRPSIIILKKNIHILKRWIENFSSTDFSKGNPFFFIDDEADAASLNTKVNKNETSSINNQLNALKNIACSSIYLQVTATPQAVLLQRNDSQWKPKFACYFHPGENYKGGDFFYPQDSIPPFIKMTPDDELEDLLNEDEPHENCLINALFYFLVISSHLFMKNKKVSNFLVHPSVRIKDQESIANKLGSYLNSLKDSLIEIFEDKFLEKLKSIWVDLSNNCNELISFDESYKFINKLLNNHKIKIIVMNSKSEISNYNYESGVNIIVGGNSLGRGVTFPNLNVVYYCRKAKTPQIDTFWQHSRIFGYDRDPQLVRLFMPKFLYKLFSELNESNNSIINQIQKNDFDINKLQLISFGNTKPTRQSVINKSNLSVITGGTNYFPFKPKNLNINKIDGLLKIFDEKTHFFSVNYHIILDILKYIDSEEVDDWSNKKYSNCIKAYFEKNQNNQNPNNQCILIVRRNRDIAKDSGTLLSPNDRDLGNKFTDKIVLIVYKITGNKDKGWNGDKIWIPNIKFPAEINFSNCD